MRIDSSVALVLAAGQGRRMGGPKALLQWQGRTLLEAVAEAYLEAGVPLVVAVVNPRIPPHLPSNWSRLEEDERADVAREETGRFCWTGPVSAEKPMMESVRWGLQAILPLRRQWIFLHPVDTGPPPPSVVEQLHRRLSEHAGKDRRAIAAKPTSGGRGGHPLLLHARALERLPWQEAPTLRDALSVLDSEEMLRVETTDARVLRNWNRPEQLPPERGD